MSDVPRYIDPLTDFGFKAIFLTQANKPLLIAFLNAVLCRIGEGSIKDLSYLPTEHVGFDQAHKSVRQDLECEAEDGRHFIVEMQQVQKSDLRERTVFYAFRSTIDAVEAWQKYWLRPVYSLTVMDGLIRPADTEFLQVATLRYDRSDERLVPCPVLLYLECPKVKELPGMSAVEHMPLEAWTYALSHLEEWSRPPENLAYPELSGLLAAAEFARFGEAEKKQYMISKDSKRGLKYVQEYYHEVGREEGLQQGMQQALRATAMHMLANGMSIDDISRMTGLTSDEIRALKPN